MIVKPIFLNAKSTAAGTALHVLAAARGFEVIDCPLILTQFAPIDAILQAQLARAQVAHWLIFISPTAARAAITLLPDITRLAAGFAAVGPATAAALARADVLMPAIGEGAQALLDCAELQNVSGQTVAIFAAPDGLSLLSDTLSARGADVIFLPVYRRVRAQLTHSQRQSCLVATHSYVGSAAFLQAFIAERAGAPLTVFAPSMRIAERARSLACRVFVCLDSSERALCAALESNLF